MAGKKILLVTGKKAASTLEEYVKDLGIPVEIHVCNIDVASLLTPEKIMKELEEKNLEDIKTIMLPGLLSGNVKKIQKELGIQCIRGPGNISQLPYILEKVNAGEKLSTDVPADEVLKKEIEKQALEEISKARKETGGYKLKIGNKKTVYLGTGPMKIIAEIPDAPHHTKEQLKEACKYYEKSGADIIDLGLIAGEDNTQKIKEMLEVLRTITERPISIDTLDEKEISAGIKAGADLILSIDETNYRVVEGVDIPVVVIPRNREGIPEKAEERIKLMDKLMDKLGGKKIIADLILNPPNQGMVESITAYKKYREKHPKTPIMLGAGNVTEMMDADSPGINALLAAVASELDVDVVFTTEVSPKNVGTIKELSKAAEMMYLAKKRKQPPKDLGIDLLKLKEKRWREPVREAVDVETIEAGEHSHGDLEDSEFRIHVSDKIEVIYYKKGKPELQIRGDKAEDIISEILSRKLIKDIWHAAYLGRELDKAETALKLGRSYIQDEDLI